MKTELIVITDRSGSMSTIKSDVDGGFATLIAEHKKAEGECRVTHVTFDNMVETLYTAKPVAEVPAFELQPRGSTALLDAIGITMNVHGKRIRDEAWADMVIVCITTDGQENASREYTREQIKNMIAGAEKGAWTFVFMAANQDGFAAATSMGMGKFAGKSFDATSAGTQSAYATMSVDTVHLRASFKKTPDATL